MHFQVHCNVGGLCDAMPDDGSNVLKHVAGSLHILKVNTHKHNKEYDQKF
jgi:hypothetical protein